MADRTFASLTSRIASSAVGCPQPTIIQHVREAAIRTCERTLLWRYEIPTYALLPGVHEYPYPVPEGTLVHAVFAALLNGRPLPILTLEQAIAQFPAWADLYSGESAATLWSLTPPLVYNSSEYNEDLFNDGSEFVLPDSVIADGGEPQAFTQVRPDKYVVLPLPDDGTYTMRMFVALKPTRSATGMDANIFDELEDAIFHNTLQHLMLQPNTNWADRELAAYHARQFLFALTERRARANLMNARGTLRAQFPSFGA